MVVEKAPFSNIKVTMSLFSPLQIQNLTTWLQTLPQGNSFPPSLQKESSVSEFQAEQFNYGQSNPTFKITVTIPSQTFVFVLRKQPDGKLLPGAHRLDREYRVLSALQKTAVPVPKPYAYCNDCTVLGVEFYAMEYVAGNIFKHMSFPDLPDPADRKQIFLEAVRVLLDLRRVEVRSLGLQSLSRPHPPWIDRQVDTWYRQYRQGIVPGVDYSSIEKLYARLVERRKKEFIGLEGSQFQASDECHLVHGDFRIDNLIFQRCNNRLKCVAVIDWELVSIGNPLADLASLLVPYYMPSHSNLTILRPMTLPRPLPHSFPSEHDIMSHYCNGFNEKSSINRTLRPYLSVALFKFAAILCGVQARAFQGNASSPFGNELGQQAYLFAQAGHEVLNVHSHDPKHISYTFPVRKMSSNLMEELCQFMEKEVMPLEDDFLRHISSDLRWTPWEPLKNLMQKAKTRGLWNLFLPKSLGGSLSNVEYAPLASTMGRCLYGANVFNCSAPDTGRVFFIHFAFLDKSSSITHPNSDYGQNICYGIREHGTFGSLWHNGAERKVVKPPVKR